MIISFFGGTLPAATVWINEPSLTSYDINFGGGVAVVICKCSSGSSSNKNWIEMSTWLMMMMNIMKLISQFVINVKFMNLKNQVGDSVDMKWDWICSAVLTLHRRLSGTNLQSNCVKRIRD